MKKKTTLLFACLLFAGVSLTFAQPKLVFPDGSKFSLGTIYRGAMAEKELTLKNSGTDTLIISRVDVSCGCTGTMISNDHIAPGQSGTLKITFNSKNFRGDVHKTVTISSNDSQLPQALIQFEGTVVENVAVSPEYLWYQDAEVGAKNTRILTIKNEGKESLQLKKFSSDLAGLEVNLPSEPLQPGQSVQLPVVYTPAAASPVLAERMTITTSDPHQTELVIAVYGNARPSPAKAQGISPDDGSKAQH